MWPAKHIILLSIAVQVAQAWRHVVKNHAEATLFREGQPPASLSTPPVNHIGYGNSVWASVDIDSPKGPLWLAGAIRAEEFTHEFESVHTWPPAAEKPDQFPYHWQVRSTAGNGDIGDIGEADPAAGQCVEYGDVVMLQVQSMANRWLTGGRSAGQLSVHTRDHFGNAYERAQNQAYSWQVRSNSGTGNVSEADLKAGQCVSYGDIVFLQVQSIEKRWLTGGRGADNEWVYTRDHLDGGYEQTIARQTYSWKLGHAPTVLRVAGEWRTVKSIVGCENVTVSTSWSRTVSDEFTAEVEAVASGGFSVWGIEIGIEISGRLTKRLASSIRETSNRTYTHEFCAEDGVHVWAWVFYVDRGDTAMGYVTTDAKIQADSRPHCFPGESLNGKYTHCREGGCIENCWSFKVGDYVLITESARGGEITEMDSSQRPFKVTFSDNAPPASGWYRESDMSVWTTRM